MRSSAAALALILCTGCSVQGLPSRGTPAPALVAAPGIGVVPAGRSHAASANAVQSWIIASTTMCPSTAGTAGKNRITIPINIVAENSSGTTIAGTFAAPIVLADADGSGATHLSRTKVANSGEGSLTLTYAPAKAALLRIAISSTVYGQTATLVISPNAPCINGAPDVIAVADKGAATSVALTGQNATPPFFVSTSATGRPNGCGSTVSVAQTGIATAAVTSRITWPSACIVFATTANGAALTGLGVLLR